MQCAQLNASQRAWLYAVGSLLEKDHKIVLWLQYLIGDVVQRLRRLAATFPVHVAVAALDWRGARSRALARPEPVPANIEPVDVGDALVHSGKVEGDGRLRLCRRPVGQIGRTDSAQRSQCFP